MCFLPLILEISGWVSAFFKRVLEDTPDLAFHNGKAVQRNSILNFGTYLRISSAMSVLPSANKKFGMGLFHRRRCIFISDSLYHHTKNDLDFLMLKLVEFDYDPSAGGSIR